MTAPMKSIGYTTISSRKYAS